MKFLISNVFGDRDSSRPLISKFRWPFKKRDHSLIFSSVLPPSPLFFLNRVRTVRQEESSLQKLIMITFQFWASSLQNYKKSISYCWSHTACTIYYSAQSTIAWFILTTNLLNIRHADWNQRSCLPWYHVTEVINDSEQRHQVKDRKSFWMETDSLTFRKTVQMSGMVREQNKIQNDFLKVPAC